MPSMRMTLPDHNFAPFNTGRNCPVSVTLTLIWPLTVLAITRTSPVSVNLMALPTRLSSTRNLERLFRQRLGITPRQGYMEIRFRLAKSMLEHSRMTLPATASELGFADASHLGRCFKNAFGVCPDQIRRGSPRTQSATDQVGWRPCCRACI